MRGSRKSYGMLFVIAIVGAILGGMLGEIITEMSLLSGVAPYLVQKYLILDIAPITVNLAVVQLSLGMIVQPNLISVAGVVTAIFLFRRF